MLDYKKNKVKRFFKNLLIVFIIVVITIFLYDMYINIDVQTYEEEKTSNVVAKRAYQTVETITENSTQIADIVEKVTKSVVGISKLKDNGNSIFLENSAGQLGLGSGVILSEDGYILTNYHVSGGKYSSCYVTTEEGKEYQATVVWADENIDLAIIKINAKGLIYVNIGDSDNVRIGETVYAIGNPIGFEFQRTVTSGIISALDRTIKIEENGTQTYMEDLIQTDATINPGNSGGPLITATGDMIGINTIKITSAEGIGFAIPINMIKPVIQSIIENGKFEEATIGVFAYDKEVIPYLNSGVKFENGIYIAQIASGGAAEKAGLKVGDVITKIDNITLNKMSQLRNYIYTKKPEEQVSVHILRNNKEMDVVIKLGKKV